VAKYQYDPFGNALALSGPLAEANLYRFSSKERHENSGLSYYLYRYYAAESQTWVNRDPIAETGGLNLYLYARNNPINWTDAFGLRWLPEPPTTATHVQCDGSGNLEIDWNPRDKDAPWAPCTKAHEQQHMEDLKDRFGENPCAGVPEGELPFPGPDAREFWRKSECKANRDNLNCLKNTCPAPVRADDVAKQKDAIEDAMKIIWECEKHGL
jgi:RHS repeat-associated protein